MSTGRLGQAGMRRRCRARMAHVEIPDPWDLQTFCASVGEKRGRPIELHPVPALEGTEDIAGAWLAHEDCDVVLFHPLASPWHREQIILHEIAHIVSGHVPSLHTVTGWIADCFPGHWNSAKVAEVLLRSRYDSAPEQEAEILAGLIESAASSRRRGQAMGSFESAVADVPDAPAEVAAVLQRFSSALGSVR